MITAEISVDCVILGFDGSGLNVLLLKRSGEENGEVFHDMKLPGSLIGSREDLDDAAGRVLYELTGLKNIRLMQFHAFGSAERTADPKDVHWLEKSSSLKIGRIVTVAYLALIRIDRRIGSYLDGRQVLWVPVSSLPKLAFDHNAIVSEAISFISRQAYGNIEPLFSLLPAKFTIPQFKALYETIFRTKCDVRNFYKKLHQKMPFVVPLGEREEGMAHRAASLYKFDRKIYRKICTY